MQHSDEHWNCPSRRHCLTTLEAHDAVSVEKQLGGFRADNLLELIGGDKDLFLLALLILELDGVDLILELLDEARDGRAMEGREGGESRHVADGVDRDLPLPLEGERLAVLVGELHPALTSRKQAAGDEVHARYLSLPFNTKQLDRTTGTSDDGNSLVLKRDWLHKHTYLAAVVSLWFASVSRAGAQFSFCLYLRSVSAHRWLGAAGSYTYRCKHLSGSGISYKNQELFLSRDCLR